MRSGLSGFGLLICALLPSASMAGVRFDVPDYLLQLPQQTYQLIESNFSRLYQQTDFTPQITNSYFNRSDLYNFVGVPLAITPRPVSSWKCSVSSTTAPPRAMCT